MSAFSWCLTFQVAWSANSMKNSSKQTKRKL